MGLFRRKRPQEDERLETIRQIHRNALRQAEIIEELNIANWHLWTAFIETIVSTDIHGKHAAQSLHDNAHEDIKPPWED